MSGKEQISIKLFNKWDTNNIQINDQGLLNVISLKPQMAYPISFGRHEHQRLKNQKST